MGDLHNLCLTLIKTYNTTIIDQMSVDLQNAFEKNAFDKISSYCSVDSYKQNEKERKVLDELIFNHFYKKIERQELTQHYIGGPCTLTCHWSEEYQKLIYIFGEEHSEHTDCKEFPENKKKNEKQSGMPIEEFLKKFIQINDIYLDIFVELPAYKQKTLNYSKPLSEHEGLSNARLFKIGTEFAECMDGYDRNPEKCSRSRIHYMDIRNIEREAASGLDAVSIFIITCFNIIDSDKDLNQKKNLFLKFAITDLGKYVMNGFLIPKRNRKEYSNFWNSMLSGNYYVDKELERNDPEMSLKISNFVKKEMKERLDKQYEDEKYATSGLINEQAKLIMELDPTIDPQTIIKYFHDLTFLLIDTNSVLVDAYTLSRIFKKFNLYPENEQKIRTSDEPETASNIIIYAGNNHSNTYRKFLEKIGFSIYRNFAIRILSK